MRVSILIPAAGASERLGQAKQLVQHNGKSLIQNAVDLACSISPREIIVISGAHQQAVKDALQHPPVRWVHNPQWSTGMGGSIALGAAAMCPESTGLMILLCDQWCIQEQDLRALLTTWQSDPARIVVAEADGHYMPPVIFPASCFRQLQRLEGDRGARSLFETHADLLTPITIENAVIDLDTPAQLAQLEKPPACNK